MKILIVPCDRPLPNGLTNAKCYPHWGELTTQLELKGYSVDVIKDIIPLKDWDNILLEYDKILTIDSFLQHYCWIKGIQCIVLWGKSDPSIFGHKENINILKDVKYLRPNQFDIWFNEPYNVDAFISVNDLLKIIEGK